MPRLRVGVVLVVPPPVGTEVDALRRAVGDPRLGRVAPHVTLVPPVNVREDRVDDALAVLRSAAAATRPLRLVLGPPATFLPVNPVLHLPVGGDLAGLAALRERVFTDPLARPLTLPFVPHVTLLDGGDADLVAAGAQVLGSFVADVVVEAVHLLHEERRDADGARVWVPRAEARFGGRAVVGRGPLEVRLEVTGTPGPDVAVWAERTWAAHDRERDEEAGTEVPLAVVARRGGDTVGLATGRVRGPEAHLSRLLVDPSVRGEGVGSHVLAAYCSAAAERGAALVRVRAPAGGRAAAFYRRRGFTHWAALPGWRSGRDFVELRRTL